MNPILVVNRDRRTLDRLEKLLLDRADHQITLADSIAEALRHTGDNRSQAARMLGVPRPTLLAKIRKYGLR